MGSGESHNLLGNPQSREQRPRTQWNPEQSDAVERVMCALVEKFRSRELLDEIRPTTLLQLGGDFALFYSAAFPRENVPKWACKRFPKGWNSFIEELNSRLEAAGLSILDSKRSIAPYRKLSADARDVIRVFQQLVDSAEISIPEAVQSLRDDFKIQLSESQQRTYFRQPCKIEPSKADSLDERVRKITQQIDTLRSELGLQFSPTVFLKGLIFEGLVGAFLAHHYRDSRVERQVRMPITYTDFEGHPHKEVYLDFRIEFLIFETKLRNDYRNIMKSALSQLAAFEACTGRSIRLTIVYGEPCPHFQIAYDQNLLLIDDANTLGLQTLSFAERRIQDAIEYVSAHDLFARDVCFGHHFTSALSVFRQHWDSITINELQYLTRSLDQITASTENIPTKLELLLTQLREGRMSDAQLASRLFGEPKE